MAGAAHAAWLLLEMSITTTVSLSPSLQPLTSWSTWRPAAGDWAAVLRALAARGASAADVNTHDAITGAFKVWHRMREQSLAVDDQTLRALLRACVDAHPFVRSDPIMSEDTSVASVAVLTTSTMSPSSPQHALSSSSHRLVQLALALFQHMSQLGIAPHRVTVLRLARLCAHIRIAAVNHAPNSSTVALIRTAPPEALAEALRVFAPLRAGQGLGGLRPSLLAHAFMYSAGAAFAPMRNRSFTLTNASIAAMRTKSRIAGDTRSSSKRNADAAVDVKDAAAQSAVAVPQQRYVPAFRPRPQRLL